MLKNGGKLTEHMVLRIIETKNDITVLKWLLKHGCPFTRLSWLWAIRVRSWSIVKWLNRNKLGSCDGYLCAVAASLGDLKMLKWLLALPQMKCVPRRLLEGAFCGGHENIFDYIFYDLAFPLNGDILRGAILSKNLRSVKWLAPRCEWNGDEISLSVELGYTEITKYLTSFS